MKLLKTLLTCFASCAAALVPAFAAEEYSSIAVDVRNVEESGYVVIYANGNPINLVSFDEDDSQVADWTCRFYGFGPQDKLRADVEKGRATVAVSVETLDEGGTDIREIDTACPSESELKACVSALENALRNKKADVLSKMYFSASNPDIVVFDGKKLSDLFREKFAQIRSIEIKKPIRCWTGPNFAMLSSEDGKIRISADGEDTFLLPIFIGKDKKTGKIRSL